MFGMTAQTLIVVYKDEMVLNQFRKMIQSNGNTENVAVNIVAWDEKVWLANKKAGTIKDKVLFLGEVKGTDQLIPVIDVQFDEFGVKFGWAGNQAVIYYDFNVLKNKTEYDEFIQRLAVLSVPEIIKKSRYDKDALFSNANEEAAEEPQISEKDSVDVVVKKKASFLFKKAKKVIGDGVEAVNNAGGMASIAEKAGIFVAKTLPVGAVAGTSIEMIQDKNFVKRQMLFYGVVHFYERGLEDFMNY